MMKEWVALVASNTENDFDRNWAHIESVYSRQISTYLSSTWVIHKERFVHAWTNQHQHFGHLTTSRVEGSHATMKTWIGTSTGDLKEAYEKIMLHVSTQHKSISTALAFEKSHHLLQLSKPIWADVQRHVSHYALKMAKKQS